MIDPKELDEMQLRTDRVALMRKESFFEHSENDIRHVIIKFINDNDRLIAEVKTLNAALNVMNDDGRQNEIRLVNEVRRLKIILDRDQVLMERTMKTALGLREVLDHINMSATNYYNPADSESYTSLKMAAIEMNIRLEGISNRAKKALEKDSV